MGHHHKVDPAELETRFEFDAATKKTGMRIVLIGLVVFILGLVIAVATQNMGGGDAHGAAAHGAEAAHAAAPAAHEAAHGGGEHGSMLVTRILSAFLTNSFFFMGISLLAIFFIAVSYAANAGWFTQLKRIAESMGYFFVIPAILLFIIFFAGGHDIYHWTDHHAMETDALLQKKEGWLNMPFFIIRNLVFVGVWMFFFMQLRKWSLYEDENPGIRSFNKRVMLSAVFLVVFALTFSSAAWDWIMSIEAHWFSTMFSVRMFSTCWVSGMAFLTLITLYLKSRGYLPHVGISIFHDLGKFIFAFSIFWTYIWFSEFLLIWYANIPEEGMYFLKRRDEFPVLFIANLIINFMAPFLILLSRGNMRHLPTLGGVCVLILFGHMLDVWLCVGPGTVMQGAATFGLLEIGVWLIFGGALFLVTTNRLATARLLPRNHPYLDESLYHQY